MSFTYSDTFIDGSLSKCYRIEVAVDSTSTYTYFFTPETQTELEARENAELYLKSFENTVKAFAHAAKQQFYTRIAE